MLAHLTTGLSRLHPKLLFSQTPNADSWLLAKKRTHLLYSLQKLALRGVALAHGLVQGLHASAYPSVHCYLSRHAMLLPDFSRRLAQMRLQPSSHSNHST